MPDLLHHIIDRSADRHPDKPAFVYGTDEVAYGDLVERANGLARALVDDGSEPGDRIGLLMPKSLETAIALFAALKAGGIAVPLDPQSPADRLAGIIADAGIRRIIVRPEQRRLVESLVGRVDSTIEMVVGLNELSTEGVDGIDWESLPTRGRAPDVELAESDPAYLLYTSGSTGEPKGILHSHRSGLAYARLSAKMYSVGPTDRLGNFAPLHFDQSTFEFYTGPLCGATTVLIPQALGFATASLGELIESEQLTFWYSVPSVLIQLILNDALVGRDLSRLRWILFGGEPFPPQHLNRLMQLLPHASFSNVYGPTETNQCTCHNIDAHAEVDEPLPIGRVWEDTEALVVDTDDQPVTVGETAEIQIRSVTMMLGYWQRPELNEFATYWRESVDRPAERFYRTGDLVRLLCDGNMEFVGRRDRQVKIRGHRVELDEVEAVLNSHPDVAEAAAVTLLDERENITIDAAVIVRRGRELTEKQVAAHAAKRLPTYARPRRIVFMNEFPRTRTNKVDRRALADRLA